jgi:hypothetical protein
MEVQVKDHLPGLGAIVDNHPETIADAGFGRNLCANPEHPSGQQFVLGAESGGVAEMFFRDHQKMDRGLGRDIFKGEQFFVFVEFVRRDFPGNDPAEDALFHGSLLFSLAVKIIEPCAKQHRLYALWAASRCCSTQGAG